MEKSIPLQQKAPGEKDEPWKKVTGLPEYVSENAILVRAGENLFSGFLAKNCGNTIYLRSLEKCADLPELSMNDWH